MEIRKTDFFARWLDGLRDTRARARVQVRIERLAMGNPGDVKPVGEGVSELRIQYGPGYRVYFKQQGNALILLLAGGDKSTQKKDIRTALELARNLEGVD
jgi:putative addiction module killer protein